MFLLHVLFFVFVFSSDLDTDDDLNSDDYEYEDEAKLVIFPDHYEIALPNIEELPALVSECARLLARCAWLSVSGVCACAACVPLGAGRAEWERRRRSRTASLCAEGLQGSVAAAAARVPSAARSLWGGGLWLPGRPPPGGWLLAACDSQSGA